MSKYHQRRPWPLDGVRWCYRTTPRQMPRQSRLDYHFGGVVKWQLYLESFPLDIISTKTFSWTRTFELPWNVNISDRAYHYHMYGLQHHMGAKE